MQNLIDAPELKRLLSYDQETGEFRWRVSRSTVKEGDIAGTINEDGYLQIQINGKIYKAHRLAWFYVTNEWPKEDIDHENMDHGDNRFINLREATRTQNNANKHRQINNASGFKGVSWNRANQKYNAQIAINRKHIHLGWFDSPSEAHGAYMEAASHYFGEFARAA